MIDISDKNYVPNLSEISTYIGNSVFDSLYGYMCSELSALYSIQYSGDKLLLGWNLKFYKGSRTLCRVYPKPGFFSVLIVVGRKEKEHVEALLPEMSETVCDVYQNTQEGMNQRWLIIDVRKQDTVFEDVKLLAQIRRESH